MDRHDPSADIVLDHVFEAHQLHDHAIGVFVAAGWRRLGRLVADAGHALAQLCHR